MPVPPPIAKSVPPRVPDVDYDHYDKDACIRRAEELFWYHGQQTIEDERNEIMKYRKAIEDEPNCQGIHFAIDLFSCRVMRAVEFYTFNDFGRHLYSDESYERNVHLINIKREFLEMAGYDHNGFPIHPKQ